MIMPDPQLIGDELLSPRQMRAFTTAPLYCLKNVNRMPSVWGFGISRGLTSVQTLPPNGLWIYSHTLLNS